MIYLLLSYFCFLVITNFLGCCSLGVTSLVDDDDAAGVDDVEEEGVAFFLTTFNFITFGGSLLSFLFISIVLGC